MPRIRTSWCGAAELDYRALAVTDRNSLAGVVRAHIAAKEVGLPLVIGAEITPADAPPVVLWATDRASYGRLCRLITRGRRQAPKGECALTLNDVAEFAQGLVAGIQPPAPPGVINETHADNNNANCKLKIAEEEPPAEPGADGLLAYRDIFPDHCYLLAELHYGADDQARLAELQALARSTSIPLVAAGDVHYHVPARMVLHDVLTAIRHRTTVAAAEGTLLFPNAERHLRPLDDIRACSPLHRTPSPAPSRSPSAAASRSMSCATNIPPSKKGSELFVLQSRSVGQHAMRNK